MAKRVTNESTSLGPRGKFCGRMDRGGISKATEDAKMVIGWGGSMKDLKRRFIMEKMGREMVY